MLAILIQDINAPTSPRNSAKFRKAGKHLVHLGYKPILIPVTATSFRDTQLLSIFESTFETFSGILHHSIPFEKGKNMTSNTSKMCHL